MADDERRIADSVEDGSSPPDLAAEIGEQRAVRELLSSLSPPQPDARLADDVMRGVMRMDRPWLVRLWQRALTSRTLTIRWNVAAAVAAVVVVVGIGAVTLSNRIGPVAPGTTVTLRFEAPTASNVAVAGDFNAWRDDTHLMSDPDEDGIWTITLELSSGRYEYVFVVDQQRWVADPRAVRFRPDGFGGKNAIIEL